LIPTLSIIEYLKLCISSIKKNTKFEHEIIVHINDGADGTEEFLISENIKYTVTRYNAGICVGINMATKQETTKNIISPQ
jgi:glycosyltransferase involved in cell wall biosynthesis